MSISKDTLVREVFRSNLKNLKKIKVLVIKTWLSSIDSREVKFPEVLPHTKNQGNSTQFP